jgi:hypothetical protein
MTAKTLRFSELSPARQALVRLCQTINYGSIEGLEVKDSEPVFDPPPVGLKDVKLDSDEGPRPELGITDFMVSNEIVRLMKIFDELGCGTIRRVEVRTGNPRRIVVDIKPLMPANVPKRASINRPVSEKPAMP